MTFVDIASFIMKIYINRQYLYIFVLYYKLLSFSLRQFLILQSTKLVLKVCTGCSGNKVKIDLSESSRSL